MEIKTKQLKNELIIWYKKNKRSFPWRETKDPWKILIIETLAQQTQLERANQYYEEFLARFPTPRSMSNSSLKVILKMWSGLGYNNRAKRLYEASKILEKKGFDEIYPNFDDLPGVGPYTKNAILSFAYGKKVLAVDTNIERVIQRYFGLDDTKGFFIENSKYLLSKVDSRDLNQAFMDFGSSICKNLKPLCTICPIEKTVKNISQKIKNPMKNLKVQTGKLEEKLSSY